ncbi:hypothetical protein B0T21DRAFT_15386 [Apiosordaria backusii]|uniref:Uncharacterized protein n=1 Tax=Apiosordaria backusii TaxID=314023 RepID=A0AA40EYS9_9PEZI|nr:hypothetical protein B0T21DRAFT_15386 [Apiosordaria backusii]
MIDNEGMFVDVWAVRVPVKRAVGMVRYRVPSRAGTLCYPGLFKKRRGGSGCDGRNKQGLGEVAREMDCGRMVSRTRGLKLRQGDLRWSQKCWRATASCRANAEGAKWKYVCRSKSNRHARVSHDVILPQPKQICRSLPSAPLQLKPAQPGPAVWPSSTCPACQAELNGPGLLLSSELFVEVFEMLLRSIDSSHLTLPCSLRLAQS